MTNKDFHSMVAMLQNPIPKTPKDKLYYGVGGMVADAGEVLDAMKDYYWYRKIDHAAFTIKMAEELSDTLHWMTAVCNTMGFTLNQLKHVNKAKLAVRYPNGWDKACAIGRDKQAEWEAMALALRGETENERK